MGKPKSGTASTLRKHVFTSFRVKVDSIKIDPVRRVRRKITDYEGQSSYFVTAFAHWTELNISADFSEFSEECMPMAQSLPLVIHFQKDIIELIWKHIEKRDENSLESLLDLITHFAHDLGPDFEPYFGSTLAKLVDLASDSNLSIVEWTFNCLAYLFKYLSRLLTPNLIPTYDVISPLFGGKKHQRQFVSRFAAESMSFLIRKSNPESMKVIIEHILDELDKLPPSTDVEHKKSHDSRLEFVSSTILLFSDAAKSSGNAIHSRSSDIIKQVLISCDSPNRSPLAIDVATGLVTGLLHHSRDETAGPIYATCYEFFDNAVGSAEKLSSKTLLLLSKVLFSLAGLRKGSRVEDWSALYSRSIVVVDLSFDADELDEQVSSALISMSVALFQCSDFSSTTKYVNTLVGKLYTGLDYASFLSLCNLSLQLAPATFKSHLVHFVSKGIKEFGSSSVRETSVFLNDAFEAGVVSPSDSVAPGMLTVSSSSEYAHSLDSVIREAVNSLSSEDDYLSIWIGLETIKTSVPPTPSLKKFLLGRVSTILAAPSLGPWKGEIVGQILRVLDESDIDNLSLLDIFNQTLQNLDSVRQSQAFLGGLLNILNHADKASIKLPADLFSAGTVSTISDSLLSSSHEVRYATIQILQKLCKAATKEVPKLLSDCQLIEDVPVDLSNARNFSMHIRNLGENFASAGSNLYIDNAVPKYLFGLLTVRLQPVWDAAITAIVKASEKSTDLVWELCYRWLTFRNDAEFSFVEFDEQPPSTEAPTDCSNLNQIIDTRNAVLHKYRVSADHVKAMVSKSAEISPLPADIRSQVIRVLINIPRVAEKHGKELVPFLLWNDEEDEGDDGASIVEASAWSWKERLTLLELFSHFTNLKSLYKSDEVHARYLYLLGHRSVEVQRLAMKCLFTYKNPRVNKYRSNLEALLDDTQFKDEIANFIQTTDEEGAIHRDDRDDVFPLAIRIMFGRSQTAKTGGVKQNRRFAVINALNYVEPKYINLFVQLSGQRLDYAAFLVQGDSVTVNTAFELSSNNSDRLRRELGFVTMLEDILKELMEKAQESFDLIMKLLLYCLYRAEHTEARDVEDSAALIKNIRSVRNTGLKCINMLLQYFPTEEWKSYFGVIYDEFIGPKLDRFAEENLQQQSALMKLFVTLSSQAVLLPLLSWNEGIIARSFFSCVNYDEVKDTVIEAVIDTMMNIVNISEELGDEYVLAVTRVAVPILLARMPVLLERPGTSHGLLEKEANLLVKLLSGGYASEDDVRDQLIVVSLSALEKSTAQVKTTVKVAVLQSLSVLLQDGRSTLAECTSAYRTLSSLFRQFTNRDIRVNLAEVFHVFGTQYAEFATVSDLIVDLNSYSQKRLGMPDFDRRLGAFSLINESLYETLNALEWLPLVYNMLFFMKDPEELAIRTNATYSMKRFIDGLSSISVDDLVRQKEFVGLLDTVVLPVIKTGIRESTEVLRSQFIEVLGYLIGKRPAWYTSMDDMECLLFSGDDEANFFNNILHLQIHRRRRAVRRLSMLAQQGQLRDTSIAHYLLPIIEHFVGGTEGDAHNLSEDTIRATGVLVRCLSWNQYRAITKRYISYLHHRSDKLKPTIRLIDAVSEALSNPVVSAEKDEDEKDFIKASAPVSGAVLLSESLPGQDKLNTFITDDIVPTMLKTLYKKKMANDDEDLTDRIPLSLPVVKFLRVLPADLLELKLPGVLTGLCQILRAKSSELRDMIRDTLKRITRILGTDYLIFIIREMKGALRRGAQLHILGFSVHSLLSGIREELAAGDLDDSAALVMDIVMEDTFGSTGSDKDADGYTTDMKEVKHQKSYDTGQILASNVTLPKFNELITPIKTLLLYEKLNIKTERKVEELLRRFALGLYHNVEAGTEKVLVMCYELHVLVTTVQETAHKRQAKEDEEYGNIHDEQKRQVENHFLVRLDSRHWDEQRTTLRISNLHILVKFIFETLRTVLGKSESLMTAENVAGFIPFLDDGLYSNFEDVQMASLRLLSFIIKLPIPGVSEKIVSFGRRTLVLIKSSPSTNTELCQASLRFLSILIRQKKEFTMKDSGLAYILGRLKPDIEEPDRQGITITFLRSVLSRSIMIPEVYEVMDQVAHVMVTNQSRVTREACRGAYFQFITEYPQGKTRLMKQLKFLVANLEYPSSSGRLSVMEVIHLLVAKVGDEHIDGMTTSFFVALSLVLINDEVPACRETAAAILGELVEAADDQQLPHLEKLCRQWLSSSRASDQEELLLRCGLQVSGIYFSKLSFSRNAELLELGLASVKSILADSKADTEGEVKWETVYQALQFVAKASTSSETNLFAQDKQELWDLVEASLLFPHSWVRLSASRLMGALYSKYKTAGFGIRIEVPLLQTTAFKYIRQLGAPSLSQELAVQIVKNLVFVCMQWQQYEEPIMYQPPTAGATAAENDVDGDEIEQVPIVQWVVRKASSILRGEKNFGEMMVSKKGCIQLLAAIIQMSQEQQLEVMAHDLVMAFYIYSTSEDERTKELKDLCTEALGMLQTKLGTTKYVQAYSEVQQEVADRRLDRKSKRAIQAVAAPDVYARKKMRKNLVKRDKRAHVKDENGYYHAKGKRA